MNAWTVDDYVMLALICATVGAIGLTVFLSWANIHYDWNDGEPW